MMPSHSFLRYVGGKTQLITILLDLIPKTFNRYFEPFVGGASLFFALNPQQAILNDINRSLMMMYKVSTLFPGDVNKLVAELMDKHYELGDELYYKIRKEYNDLKKTMKKVMSKEDAVKLSAYFIYLNRTCFNGLYRENNAGEFNAPAGTFSTKPIFDSSKFAECVRKLRNATFRSREFDLAVADAREGDVIYFDPPYVPSNRTSFTKFSYNDFRQEDQVKLANLFRSLATRNVSVILSNNDAEAVRELYKGMNIIEVQEKRNVNSDIHGRGRVKALIITGGPR